ncbi:glycosyltransferase [Plantactinospora sp. KLBMP9567]|uniref:glycosyltransferase n=1 Tax=Plantactinospora sp. KLBMP9567 TaxID=3085900 RepID=UPI002981613F|nr:glycosyltransferase [Plantactinospora sp. KLBMP9567]MDW5327577.1 glycosyltransferase [Plantactinospora sp. KLBMP9567]
MSSPSRATTAHSPVRLFRNDWSRLTPPELGGWQPTRSVSLIIPAHDCQPSLDLTLAALHAQTYPSGLLEAVVVDDGSDPPLVLPRIRPDNCRLLRVADHAGGWGRSTALHVGAEQSEGEILHWLDADMVVFPEHVAAQARWQHVSDEVVTLGYKRFVDADWPTPEQVAESCSAGTTDRLFRLDDSEPHEYVERLIDDTDQLRGGDHLNFRAHVGATAALARSLYAETGGLNPELRLGEDTEFGYRLAQAGAVFVPEPRARSWHLGRSHMMARGEALRRYNRPFLADLMPQPRYLRSAAHRSWAVPLVVAAVRADGPYEMVRTCVDRLLAGDQTDLRVVLVADWAELTDDRRSVLADPLLDLRLLAATYRSEPRVELAGQPPTTAYPAPYLLELGSHLGVDADTVRRLVAVADQWQVGLVRLLPIGATAPDDGVSLWRTSALSRAFRVRRPDEALDEAVAEVAGRRWVSGDDFGVIDLRLLPENKWSSPRPRLVVRPDKRARQAALAGVETIPVGGIRSLASATRFVAGRYAGLAADRVRQRVRRPSAPVDR